MKKTKEKGINMTASKKAHKAIAREAAKLKLNIRQYLNFITNLPIQE